MSSRMQGKLTTGQEGNALESIFATAAYGAAFSAYRHVSPKAMEFWCRHIRDTISSLQKPSPVLADLGCGVGRFSIPFAQLLSSYPGRVIAIDNSAIMLRELNRQQGTYSTDNITAVFGDLVNFRCDYEVDVFFASEVLHAVRPLEAVLESAAACAAPHSAFIIRSPSHQQLADILWLRFLDGALEMDIARTTDVPVLCKALHHAGFDTSVTICSVAEDEDIPACDFLSALEKKAYSLLHFIPSETYTTGLQRARSYCSQHSVVNTQFQLSCVTAWRSFK